MIIFSPIIVAFAYIVTSSSIIKCEQCLFHSPMVTPEYKVTFFPIFTPSVIDILLSPLIANSVSI